MGINNDNIFQSVAPIVPSQIEIMLICDLHFSLLPSISSTFYVHIFHMNVVLAAFHVRRKSCRNNVRTKNLHVKCWWNWHLGSNSSTFYSKLLRAQIPKAQKKTESLTVLLAHLGFSPVKDFRKMLVKLTFCLRRYLTWTLIYYHFYNHIFCGKSSKG